ncbi:MAG: repeat containing protein [Verrucomicrobiales bacterium]|nr:repeat containing protein [Verrucomicrobiales bacterium]
MNWHLLQNSLLVSGSAALGAVVLGICAALWATGLPKGWQSLLLATAAVTFSLPPFLVTNCWLHLLGEAGSWRSWLPWSIYSNTGAAWILALMLWPISFFAAWSSLKQLQNAHLETDLMLRGRSLAKWLLWPMARPLIGVALGLTFVLALNNFSVPVILQVKVFPAELWLRYSTQFDYRAVLWFSIPMVLAPAILLWLWPKRAFAWSAKAAAVSPALFRRQLGKPLFFGAGAVGVLLLGVSLVVPMVHLLGSPRTWSELPTVFKAEPRLFIQSALLAAAAAACCGLVGLLGSRTRWGAALWLPLLAPGVLIGVALIFLLNRPVLDVVYHSLALMIFSWALRYSGIAWNGLARAMHSVDADLVEDATLNGARGWTLFRLAYLPRIGVPAALLCYVTYLLCLWDVETIVLTYPPGGETLALRIFNLLHYGHTAQVNALCLLLLVLAIAPLVVWFASRRMLHYSLRAGMAVLPLAFLAGCSDDTLQSRFFSDVQVLGTRGTRMGEFNKPRSLTADNKDNLYVVDMTGRVQKFSPDGKFLLSWQMPETDLGKPKGMGCDISGNVLVLEPHYQRVNHFSTDGKLLAQWGSKGTNEGFLALPRSIVANKSGNIYVSEYTTVDRVQCFSPAGKFLFSFGKPGTGNGEFNRAEGLAIDSSNRVYVADSCNHRIQVFSAEGKFLRTYGGPGSGKGQLSYPYDIRVDAQGYQYVCEFGNSRIQIFDSQDQSMEVIGGIGGAPGKLNNPWSIALDSQGNLYVADANNHRVQKFLRAKKNG